jgi:hypothetical protein
MTFSLDPKPRESNFSLHDQSSPSTRTTISRDSAAASAASVSKVRTVVSEALFAGIRMLTATDPLSETISASL